MERPLHIWGLKLKYQRVACITEAKASSGIPGGVHRSGFKLRTGNTLCAIYTSGYYPGALNLKTIPTWGPHVYKQYLHGALGLGLKF